MLEVDRIKNAYVHPITVTIVIDPMDSKSKTRRLRFAMSSELQQSTSEVNPSVFLEIWSFPDSQLAIIDRQATIHVADIHKNGVEVWSLQNRKHSMNVSFSLETRPQFFHPDLSIHIEKPASTGQCFAHVIQILDHNIFFDVYQLHDRFEDSDLVALGPVELEVPASSSRAKQTLVWVRKQFPER